MIKGKFSTLSKYWFPLVVAIGLVYGLSYPFLQINQANLAVPDSAEKQAEIETFEKLSKPSDTEAAVALGDDFLEANGTSEKAILPAFSQLPVLQKKQQFFTFLAPFVEQKNQQILLQRQQLLAWSAQSALSTAQQQTLQTLRSLYYISESVSEQQALAQLLVKLDVLPTSLVLVQGANESAWGTSRFAREGYNFFGLWCYRKGCGFVPKNRIKNASHEVAKFDTIAAGIDYYFLMINRHRAYNKLRSLRHQFRKNQQTVLAEVLVDGLQGYSQRGEAYTQELGAMLKTNRTLIKNAIDL